MSRPAIRAPIAALSFLLALPGCAAQLGGGLGMAVSDPAPRGMLVAEARTFSPRKSGPLLGTHMVAAVGESQARPVRLRSAALAVGYHLMSPRAFPLGLGGEAAIEVGVGAPLRQEWDGLGAYLGLGATALYRVWGPGDAEPRFDTVTTLVDLALNVRGGAWSAPEGTGNPTRAEGSLGLALRVTISTDLSTSLPPEDRNEPPAQPTTTSPKEF